MNAINYSSNADIFKPVELKKFNDNNGLNEIQEEFIECLKKCEKEIIGSERIGQSVEFYDEDGAVLLFILFDDVANKANFEFVMCEKSFDLSLQNIPEMFLSA